MCGRFTLFTAASRLAEVFLPGEAPSAAPRYNIAPSRPVLTVRVSPSGGRREFATPRWGLIPPWAKDASIGNRLINARAETAAEKPSFRRAFRERRCLVPADGFYEWKKDVTGKHPFYIHRRDGSPFAFAGIWERWEGIAGEAVETCAILTTAPNGLLAPLHDRMPVILSPAAYDRWLDPSVRNPELLAPLIGPYPGEELEAYPVGKAVNDPATDDPSCIRPAGTA